MDKQCKTCGKLFTKKVNVSKKKWETMMYCSLSCINSGRPSHNKGVPMSEERKEYYRRLFNGRCTNTGRTHIKQGQRLSPETEFKKGMVSPLKGIPNPRFQGANNPNWKGGITPEHLKIRWSTEMKNWRKQIFERDNYTCQLCGKHGGNLNADHIKSFAKYPDLRFDLSNGRTLCVPCHRNTDSYGRQPAKTV